MFYIKDSDNYKSFINEKEIFEALQKNKGNDIVRVREIIQKSIGKNRLSPDETAYLLNLSDPECINELFRGAERLKKEVYGNRIVLFAPLYIGNECINDCQYCGFRISNKEVFRRSLTEEEVGKETLSLIDKGHKRLILVYGEHPMYDAGFICKTIEKVYGTKKDRGEIRRANINAAPQVFKDYKRIKETGIGTFQIFQETYHYGTYKKIHPTGPKSSYIWRLYGLDRAIKAGLDDVGIGALFGLYDYRYEVMGLLYHTMHFEERFGFGPHTISFPRIEPAINTPLAKTPPNVITDEKFKKIVAVLRLSVPYTGLILTAREPENIRKEVMKYGVSQIDAGSNIGVGAYSRDDEESYKKSQFVLGDQRSLDEVVGELTETGFVPSFCTACYRMGRTGEHFMEFAVPGFVKRFCTPNAILTLMEYITDYASEKTAKSALKQIKKEINNIPESKMKEQLKENIKKVESGVRDVYF